MLATGEALKDTCVHPLKLLEGFSEMDLSVTSAWLPCPVCCILPLAQ